MNTNIVLTIFGALAVCAGGFGSACAQNIVVNGDFTANAADFVTWPGYASDGVNNLPNPDGVYAIQGWLDYFELIGAGNPLQGINGPATGLTPANNPFGPDVDGGRTYAFLQGGGGNLLGQYLTSDGTSTGTPTLEVNSSYRLRADIAGRAGNAGALFSVFVANDDSATPVYSFQAPNVPADTTQFIGYDVRFNTPAALTGAPNIQLWNQSPAGDLTVVFANISIVKVVPGDYDYDNDVDGDDYLVWRQSFGSIIEAAADGNANGVVDAADYVIWRDNDGFGFPAGAGSLADSSGVSAVPEPAAIVLAAWGLLAAGAVRSRRRWA
jgi:hypothetical protein